jgi:hypothetical protein
MFRKAAIFLITLFTINVIEAADQKLQPQAAKGKELKTKLSSAKQMPPFEVIEYNLMMMPKDMQHHQNGGYIALYELKDEGKPFLVDGKELHITVEKIEGTLVYYHLSLEEEEKNKHMKFTVDMTTNPLRVETHELNKADLYLPKDGGLSMDLCFTIAQVRHRIYPTYKLTPASTSGLEANTAA